jgi:hypothetical protein
MNQWDNCIRSSKNAFPFGYSWFLKLTSKSSWGGLVSMSTKGSYDLVLPLQFENKFGVRIINQSPFIPFQHVYRGTNLKGESDEAIRSVLQEKFKYCAHLILHNPFHIDNNVSCKRTYQIELNNPIEIIRKSYREYRARSLKKAKSQNLQVVESTDVDPMLQKHRQYVLPRIDYSLVDGYYQTWRNILQMLLLKQEAVLVYALNGKEVDASALFIVSDALILYYFAASTPNGRNSGAATLLIDYIFEKYANTDRVFDFLGSEMPNLAYFKRSFGATEAYYQEIQINNLPAPVKFLQKLRQKIFYPGFEKKIYN